MNTISINNQIVKIKQKAIANKAKPKQQHDKTKK